ncbi:MAG: prepilin peptidase [Candidatus Micrarchaeia archaeon]
MDLYIIRIILLLSFTFAYAFFDVYNKRNIPSGFAYASLALAIVFTLLYPVSIIVYSILVAAVVGIFCYLLYKTGMLGAGDGFELIFISLLIPIQPMPLINVAQLNLPFILSIFISTGIVTVVAVPVYYLITAKERLHLQKENLLKALTIFFAYLILLLFMIYLFGVRLLPMVIVLLLAFFSTIIILFESSINIRMIEWIYPKSLDDGDIIALNLMSASDLSFFNKNYKDFGKLATASRIKGIRNLKRKIPVYKNAVPFSLFIFIGVLISLAIGNPLFAIFL